MKVFRKLLVLLFLASLFTVSLLASTVHAEYPESREGERYLGVWVAFDEESIPSDPDDFLLGIKWALNEFKREGLEINYAICYYDTWESYNFTNDALELLQSATIQLGWQNGPGDYPPRHLFGNWTLSDETHSMDTNWANVLLAISGQDLDLDGWGYWYWNACIVDTVKIWPQSVWKATVHELGHVFNLTDCDDFGCWMCENYYWCAGGFTDNCYNELSSTLRNKFTWRAPPWDVNEDAIVNIVDITYVVFSFGYTEGEPDYNPDADVNNDGIVDMRDLRIVGYHLLHVYLADL